MGTDSSAGWRSRRRGSGRAVLLSAACIALLSFGACGKSGNGAETNPEKGADAAFLNVALAQELAILDAYTQGQPLLGARQRSVVRQLRAQTQEYVNALTKALRGLGGDVEVEPEELDASRLRSQADLLALAYELESAALASYLEAAPRLYTAAPRTLDAALAAGHAQHLVVLRQALGVDPASSIPEAFDGGVVPPPSAAAQGRG